MKFWRAASVTVCASLTMAGCSLGPVDLGEGPPSTTPECAGLIQSLPVVVDNQRIRALAPAREDAMTWGDPPIVLICGGSPPSQLAATSSLIDIGGVTWFAEPRTNGTAFFTVDRSDTVEILIPADYRPEASIVVELAPFVDDALPLQG